MDILERMMRVQQRSYGNPYKEGSRQWLAWAKGYNAGRLDPLLKQLERGQKLMRKMNRSSTRNA